MTVIIVGIILVVSVILIAAWLANGIFGGDL